VGVQSKSRSRRPYFVAAGVVVVAIVLAFEWRSLVAWIKFRSLFEGLGGVFVDYLPLTLPAVIALGVILFLERVFPVHGSSVTGGRALAEDVLWMLLVAPVAVFGTFWFARGVTWVFDHPLAGTSVDLTEYLPFAVVFVICFVLGDFINWFSHYLKHRVPLFWRFHSVHHSAINLSLFTDARVHVGEFFINRTLSVLPFFVIGGDATVAVPLYLVGRLWYARFEHANVRMNFGPLRHVLVSPQYHRMHHSIEARDVDMNFAGIFPIWDRLFGTQVDDRDRYPDTGINDPEFPRARSRNPIALLRAYGAQFLYPFRTTSRSMAGTPTQGKVRASGVGLTQG